MKIYAKQVAPEWQESPLFIEGCFPDNITVCGNRYYNEHLPKVFEKVQTVLKQGELAEVLEYPKECADWYKNATEAINDYLPPENGKKYSTNAIHALRCLVLDYSCCACSCENEILCKVLSIVDGRAWDWQIIRGSCQSDWQEVFFPVDEWSKEALADFETQYFNEGTEWLVDDGEYDPENDSPLNINGYSIYCTSWSEDGIRQEIADAEGTSPENVVLYAFDGYIQTPKYREVLR